MKRVANSYPGRPRNVLLALGFAACVALVLFTHGQDPFADKPPSENLHASTHAGAEVSVAVTNTSLVGSRRSGQLVPQAGGAFATIWALELDILFNLSNSAPLPNPVAKHSFTEVLQRIKAAGITFIFTSMRWRDQEAAPAQYDFRLQDYVQTEVCRHGLQLTVLLDAYATPPWLLQLHPDAAVGDALGDPRTHVSFNHDPAMELVHRWHDAALARLAAVNSSCIHSVQPSFNNEYETKYSQERDAFQDYSPASMAKFQSYLRGVDSSLTSWNKRWATTFAAWDAVIPSPHFQHMGHHNNTLTDTFYWDFQHFRHIRLARVMEQCCMQISAHGFKSIMHFGEFFSGNDAIYASGVVFLLAASPWLDYVVVDSNFLSAGLNQNDIRIVQALISAIKPFGKPSFFEGAFEQFNDKRMQSAAVSLAISSGTSGVGFTNWLDRTPRTFFTDALRGLKSRPNPKAPAIALVAPYRSYLAYKGLPLTADGVRDTIDFQQHLLFECLNTIQSSAKLLDGLHIFAVPSMLLPSLHMFDQLWYLQPDVLLSGDSKAIDTIRHYASALNLTVSHCVNRHAQPLLVRECCPSW